MFKIQICSCVLIIRYFILRVMYYYYSYADKKPTSEFKTSLDSKVYVYYCTMAFVEKVVAFIMALFYIIKLYDKFRVHQKLLPRNRQRSYFGMPKDNFRSIQFSNVPRIRGLSYQTCPIFFLPKRVEYSNNGNSLFYLCSRPAILHLLRMFSCWQS